MKLNDIKIGMKVVPINKSIGCALQNSGVWKLAQESSQEFLYVTGKEYDSRGKPQFLLSNIRNAKLKDHPEEPDGDYFLARDFKRFQ